MFRLFPFGEALGQAVRHGVCAGGELSALLMLAHAFSRISRFSKRFFRSWQLLYPVEVRYWSVCWRGGAGVERESGKGVLLPSLVSVRLELIERNRQSL